MILPGLSADNLPYDAGKEISINASIDGERRLFYVAMTRARRSLWLISPPEPEHDHEERMPSPFLGEIQFELSELVGHKLHTGDYPLAGKMLVEAEVTEVAKHYVKAINRKLTLGTSKTSNTTRAVG